MGPSSRMQVRAPVAADTRLGSSAPETEIGIESVPDLLSAERLLGVAPVEAVWGRARESHERVHHCRDDRRRVRSGQDALYQPVPLYQVGGFRRDRRTGVAWPVPLQPRPKNERLIHFRVVRSYLILVALLAHQASVARF